MKEHLFTTIAYLLLLPTIVCAGNTYYVDPVSGNDTFTGKSIQNAWRSLERVNSTTFLPGDKIYLKRGQTFEGSLLLKGSGTLNNVITLGAYGTGKRPVLISAGKDFSIQVMDASYWQISDIETTGSNMAGIFIGCTKDDLTLDHFRITNCYVHNIGDTAKLDWDYSKSTGGIIAVNGTFDKEGKPLFYNSVLNDIIINNCTVRYNHRWTCISISSGKAGAMRGNANYIKNCITEFSSADGIRMNGVRNSFIEYCVMYRNGAWPVYPGKNLGGLGAWFFDADNCTIQYCEASHVQAATTDGGAFDIDYWQTNSTIQYSYGHHCAGYGVSVFGADPGFVTENSVVRYNILKDNGKDSAFAYQGDFYIFTWNGGLLNGVRVHDNISFWNPAAAAPSLHFNANFSGDLPNTFTNNTIYSSHSWLASFKSDSLKADSNRYWVTSGKPLWEERKIKYHSLQEWQRNSRQDNNSLYTQDRIKIPGWYRSGIQSNLRIREKGRTPVAPGENAPFIKAKSIQGKKADLRENNNHPVLLSFISIGDDNNENDRQGLLAQLAFIKSMKRQYESKGLKIILVNIPTQTGGDHLSKETLASFIADHELENIPLVWDKANNGIAAKYGVHISPTIFLVSKNGNIAERWENVTLPAQFALAIENEFQSNHPL